MKKTLVKIILSFCLAIFVAVSAGLIKKEYKYYRISIDKNQNLKSGRVEINEYIFEIELSHSKDANDYKRFSGNFFIDSDKRNYLYYETKFNKFNFFVYGILSFATILLLLLIPEIKGLRSIE